MENSSIGQKATRSITLTSERVKTYAEITGDHNPLHFDEDFVSKTKFKKLVVQGGLTTGLLHVLVVTDMPGPGRYSSARTGNSLRRFSSAIRSQPRQKYCLFTSRNPLHS